MIKILLLSRYENLGASSRYRSYQYIPYLRKEGIKITEAPLFDNDYIRDLYNGRKKNLLKVLKAYVRRILNLYHVRDFDLIWIEKEALPWLPAWIEHKLGLAKATYIVDYDDAIFHRYDQHHFKLIRWILGKKIDRIMQYAALVLVGNKYLLERAKKAGVLVGNKYLLERAKKAGAKRVEVLPTVIDLEKYPTDSFNNNEIFTIGWIGSPITSHYLKIVMPALEEFCKKNTARIVLIGAKKEKLPNIPVEYVSWSEETVIKEIQKFDVGIMPLPDNAWERGKCGFKLIQYMACGLSVVGSPVGVNAKIIKDGVNGYQAKNTNEWIWALQKLKGDQALRQKMGRAGREIVEKEYCLQVTTPRLRDLIISVVEGLEKKE